MPSAPFSPESLAFARHSPAAGDLMVAPGPRLVAAVAWTAPADYRSSTPLYQHRQRRQLQRLALFELEELQRDYSDSQNPQQLLEGLSRLLRQSAILHFPQHNCAGLVGSDWLIFLDQQLEDQPFSQGPGQLLAEAPYRPQSGQINSEALLALCRRWLQQLPPAPKPQGRQR